MTFRPGWQTEVLMVCAVLTCLTYAQNLRSERTLIPVGPYRIAGTVVGAKNGIPLARARVAIGETKNRQGVQTVLTADDGHFEFHVPAGKYSLEGAKRGFISAAYDHHDQFSTAIVAGTEFDTTNLILRLTPDAVLTGKVLDESGEPVRRAQITLYREMHVQGVSRIVQVQGTPTDDQGRYELTQLDEGTYFVSAKAQPWYAVHPPSSSDGSANSVSQVDPSLDVAYPVTYYGDATEAGEATPIPVRGGDRLEADIHLTPAPSLHLILHVPTDPSQGMMAPQLWKTTFDGMDPVQSEFRSVGEGVYEVTGVAAGTYTVRVQTPKGQMTESSEININNSGELDLPPSIVTSEVKVTARTESGASLPPRLQVILRPGKGKPFFTQTNDKGEANFSNVTPGKYDVVAGSLRKSYAVVSITSEAGTTTGHTLNVPPGASLNISLTLVAGSVTVEGFAKRAERGESGVMIVLVPKNPETNRERFRRDQSDVDGSFSLPDVVPGSYTILAIKDGWDLDWGQPGALTRYLSHGQKTEVGGGSATMELAIAVEVQSK